MTIGAIAALPLHERCGLILSRGRDDIAASLELAKRQGLNVDWVSRSDPQGNLAWAVAWNLPDQTRKMTRPGGDQGPDAPFADLWGRMIRPCPLRDPPESTTCLCDLAWSVACEQRTDWHVPDNERIPAEKLAFRCLWDRYDTPIRNVLRSKYRSATYVDVDSCVNEGWARVYANYWLGTARRRFLGLSPIKNFVITISIYCAEKERKKHGAPPKEVGGPGQAPGGKMERLLHSPEHRLAIMQSLATLPAKQALYAYCRLLLGLQQNAIADIWDTSEANIAQQLGKAWPQLRTQPEFSDAFSIIEATTWEERAETDPR